MGLMELLQSIPAIQERQLLGITKDQQTGGLGQLNTAVNTRSQVDSVNDYLLKQFKSPAIAAGIAGNIDVETGGTFDFKQQQKGGSAVGLFQMEYPPMKKAYKTYLNNNKLQDGAESQIDFVKSALESDKDYEIGGGNRIKLQKAFKTEDPQVISKAFMQYFERPGEPHETRRDDSAVNFFKKFTGE